MLSENLIFTCAFCPTSELSLIDFLSLLIINKKPSKDNATHDHDPLTMVGGYCTLLLIKIDLRSRGGLPIDLSLWIMEQGLDMG